jgi:hypothetical protein
MKAMPRIVALAIAAALACVPAFAADPPAGMVRAEGGLRHEATGVVVPDELDGMRPFVSGTEIVMALYMPANPNDLLTGNAAIIGISRMEQGPDYAGMQRLARESFHETGVPSVIEESAFTWPGHPDAVTFHGLYTVGPYRKDYWRGLDKGWDATMIVTSPRNAKKRSEKRSRIVAEKVYGGAVIVRAPAP